MTKTRYTQYVYEKKYKIIIFRNNTHQCYQKLKKETKNEENKIEHGALK